MIKIQKAPPIYLLGEEFRFPDVEGEWGFDDMVAVGGDLHPKRIVEAYRNGIFPWFMEEGVVYWFSPNPRMIIEPGSVNVSKSLQKTIRKGVYEVRFDTAFEAVMRGCATVERKGEEGTWITEEFIAGYTSLAEKGVARSVEAWEGDDLVGGLYGLQMGRVFFGESMFSRKKDASKVCLVALSEKMRNEGMEMIDCQVSNPHLKSLGGIEIPREHYLRRLRSAL